jgi:hypothetical protein
MGFVLVVVLLLVLGKSLPRQIDDEDETEDELGRQHSEFGGSKAKRLL